MNKIPVSSESFLINKLKDGDESAFKEVFDEWFDRIYVFSYKYLKNEVLSQEIVQETMIKLWLSREKLDENLQLGPYIFTIARRLSLNALRQIASSTQASKQLFLNMREAVNTTEDALSVAELEKITEQALSMMPSQQQLVYRMSRNQGLSLDEISVELGIMKNTVKKHLSEALKAIRKHYSLNYCLYFISLLSIIKK